MDPRVSPSSRGRPDTVYSRFSSHVLASPSDARQPRPRLSRLRPTRRAPLVPHGCLFECSRNPLWSSTRCTPTARLTGLTELAGAGWTSQQHTSPSTRSAPPTRSGSAFGCFLFSILGVVGSGTVARASSFWAAPTPCTPLPSVPLFEFQGQSPSKRSTSLALRRRLVKARLGLAARLDDPSSPPLRDSGLRCVCDLTSSFLICALANHQMSRTSDTSSTVSHPRALTP